MDEDGRRENHKTLKPRLFPIIYLVVIASGGGLVFGYYVGFIIARFGVLSDFNSILHEIVRTGLLGAILGAAAGGWANDCLGRKCSLLIADALIFIGAVLLIFMFRIVDDFYSNYYSDTIGNMFIALGVGMASMTSPLYISEFSPPKLRDILVSINFILYGFGKFIFLYLYNADSILHSNYVIPLAGLTALSQFSVMLLFPESPMWLYKKGREDDSIKVLKSIYTCSEVEKEFDAFKLLIRSETTDEDELIYSGSSIFFKIRSAWSISPIRKQFIFGTCLQAAQQLVGINALIYCIPSIYRMIGFEPSDPDIPYMKRSIQSSYGIPPIFGGLCCTFYLFVRVGKRKMLCWSIYFMIGGVLGLSFLFIVSANIIEVLSGSESTVNFKNNTCLSYITVPNADLWDFSACIRASNGTSQVCENRSWSTKHCEHNVVFTLLVFLSFLIYTYSYSGSLEIVPWIVNSQIYPTEIRGICGGTAAAANWTFFLVIILLSFFFTNTQGPLITFLLISLLSFLASLLIKSFVPENIAFFIAARKGD